jgi:hypothetical protein
MKLVCKKLNEFLPKNIEMVCFDVHEGSLSIMIVELEDCSERVCPPKYAFVESQWNPINASRAIR